jgi:hypothetical protein
MWDVPIIYQYVTRAPCLCSAVADICCHKHAAVKDQETVEGGGEAAQEATLPFEPITLVCRHLRYFVDAPKGALPFETSYQLWPSGKVWVCATSEGLRRCCVATC